MKRIFAALFLSVAAVQAQEVRPAIPVNSGPVVVTPNAQSVPAVPVAPATPVTPAAPVVPVAPEAPLQLPIAPAPMAPAAESWNDLAQYLAGMPVQSRVAAGSTAAGTRVCRAPEEFQHAVAEVSGESHGADPAVDRVGFADAGAVESAGVLFLWRAGCDQRAWRFFRMRRCTFSAGWSRSG